MVSYDAGENGEVANSQVYDEDVDSTADVVTTAARQHDDDDDVA